MRNQKYIEEFVSEDNQKRLDKLPKWARSLVGILAMRAHEAEARTDKILAERPGRVVLLDHRTYHSRKEIERSLGDNSTVRFYLKDPKAKDAWLHVIDCRLRGGSLEIVAYNGSLIVSPQSSNVMQARVINHMDLHHFQETLEKAEKWKT